MISEHDDGKRVSHEISCKRLSHAEWIGRTLHCPGVKSRPGIVEARWNQYDGASEEGQSQVYSQPHCMRWSKPLPYLGIYSHVPIILWLSCNKILLGRWLLFTFDSAVSGWKWAVCQGLRCYYQDFLFLLFLALLYQLAVSLLKSYIWERDPSSPRAHRFLSMSNFGRKKTFLS